MATTPIFSIFKYALGDIWNPIVESATQADSIETAMKGMPAFVVDATDRDARFGTTPADGSACWRADKQWEERYFSQFSATNPGGTITAGWFPVSGNLPYLGTSGGTSQAITANTTSYFTPTTILRQKDMTMPSGTSLVNITQSGLYDISASIRWSASPTDGRMYIQSGPGASTTYKAAGGASIFQTIAANSVYAQAGNQLGVAVFNTAAGTLTTSQRSLEIRYVGPA